MPRDLPNAKNLSVDELAEFMQLMRIRMFLRGPLPKYNTTLDRQSSGSATLDQETLAMLMRAQPMPQPPEQVSDRELSFVVPVRFSLPVRFNQQLQVPEQSVPTEAQGKPALAQTLNKSGARSATRW
jgi:hypothetical protein